MDTASSLHFSSEWSQVIHQSLEGYTTVGGNNPALAPIVSSSSEASTTPQTLPFAISELLLLPQTLSAVSCLYLYYMKIYTSCLLKCSEFKGKLMGHFSAEKSQNIANTKIMLDVIVNW